MQTQLFPFTDWEMVADLSVYSFFKGVVNVYSHMQNDDVEEEL